MTHNPHDALFKETFSQKDNIIVELRAALPPSVFARLDLDALEVVPGSFIDEDLSAVHCDLLYRVPIDGKQGYVYVLLEHQSTVDALMAFRVLVYVVRVLERHIREAEAEGVPVLPLPVVIPIVLHHSDTGWTAATSTEELFDTELMSYAPKLSFILDDISHASDTALMARTASDARQVVSLVLWVLRDSRATERLLASIPVWGPLLGPQIPPEMIHRLIQYLLFVVSDLSAETIIGELAANAPTKETIMTAAEQLIQKGRDESRVAAEQLIQKGRAEGARSVLLKLLTLKFGAISDEMEARIASADVAQVERWSERVLTATSAADVLK